MMDEVINGKIFQLLKNQITLWKTTAATQQNSELDLPTLQKHSKLFQKISTQK